MKTMRLIKSVLVVFAAAVTFASCNDDDDYVYIGAGMPNALVTIKPTDTGNFYMQLDNKTTMYPVNVNKSPYGDKEVRALVNCYRVETIASDNVFGNSISVFVNWMDSIRTKPTEAYPATDVDKKYGNDPVEIVNDWVTVAEDGYLTLRFRTRWGGRGTVHYVNLLAGGNANDSYEVEFRHDAKGDTNGTWGDALVAFKLPETIKIGDKEKKLTLKYKSFTGEKTVQFDLESGKGTLVKNDNDRAAYSVRVK